MSVHSHSGANKAANKHVYIGANINQQTQSDTHSNTYSRAPLWKFHSLCPEISDFETNGMYQSLSLARQSIKKKEKKKNVYSIMKAIANHFLCLFKHACSASSVEITALERARQDRIMLSITANKVSCDCSEFLTRRVHTDRGWLLFSSAACCLGHFYWTFYPTW